MKHQASRSRHVKAPSTSEVKNVKSDILPKFKTGKEGNSEIEKLIHAILPAQSRIHWFYLNTTSYNEHLALNEFFKCLHEALSCLAEQYVEHHGSISEYKGHEYYKTAYELVVDLKTKAKACKSADKGMQASIDALYVLLVKTCYKLNME